MSSLPPVGLQPIVLGKQYSLEDDQVLDHVAACGYAAIECGARDPKQMRARLDARGLKHAGAHANPRRLENIDDVIESVSILGGANVCNSGLLNWNERKLDDYKKSAAFLNHAGERLVAAGIGFHYHNHDFEFQPIEDCPDKKGIEVLLSELDPKYVNLCVDVGWVKKAGSDPAAFLNEHKDRVTYLHFKDFDDEDWTELGSGVVDFDPLVEFLKQGSAVRVVCIEQDRTRRDPLESVKLGRQFLKERYSY